MRRATCATCSSFLPPNNLETPPRVAPGDDPLDRRIAELDSVVPDEPNKPYDMREVVGRIVDDGDFFEVHAHYARNIIVRFRAARTGVRSA